MSQPLELESRGILIVDESALTGNIREGAEETLRAWRPIHQSAPKRRYWHRIRQIDIHYEVCSEPQANAFDPVNDLPPKDE